MHYTPPYQIPSRAPSPQSTPLWVFALPDAVMLGFVVMAKIIGWVVALPPGLRIALAVLVVVGLLAWTLRKAAAVVGFFLVVICVGAFLGHVLGPFVLVLFFL